MPRNSHAPRAQAPAPAFLPRKPIDQSMQGFRICVEQILPSQGHGLHFILTANDGPIALLQRSALVQIFKLTHSGRCVCVAYAGREGELLLSV